MKAPDAQVSLSNLVQKRGIPKGMQLVSSDELSKLRAKAQELDDYMAAQQKLSDRHYAMMDLIRGDKVGPIGEAHAQGWLLYESEFGEALLQVMREDGRL